MAFVLVFGGIYLFSGIISLALLLGSLATATAPAGTVAVIESYRAKGPLTNSLYAVVGLDDALAIIIFTFGLVAAEGLVGGKALHFGLMMIPFKGNSWGLGLGRSLGCDFFIHRKNTS